jgi:hypothetical protein
MAYEKRYTAKQAALAVLKKTEELLKFSTLAKALNPADGKPAPATPAPMLALSEDMEKAENPDEKQDAKLGEDIEHLCEEHMLENKAAERKEGHKIVAKSDCMKCNLVKPTPASGQGDTLRRPTKEAEWQMDKSAFSDLSGDFAALEEMFKGGMSMPSSPLGGTGSGTPSTPTSRPDAGFGKVIARSEDGMDKAEEGGSDVGSKKLGYKPSKLGAEEKDQEMPSDKAFEVEGKEHKSSDDPRMGHTPDPDKNPKEMAEGNNPEPGDAPGQDSHIKGHMKLAKFIGRMEHKRSLSKAGGMMDKAATGHEKGIHAQPKRGEAHEVLRVDPKGVSPAGAATRAAQVPALKDKYTASAKEKHKKVLGEMKAQPKPKLPR